jgi:spore germination cell wall hydrolase CwlJ-like protein
MDNAIQVIDITDGALFYHADYVTPSWAKIKQKTTEIGDHIFYKWEEK